jgi:glycosyltransferase involved in cell wall biosynthesis
LSSLVSILINVYNGEKYIEKCINSVLSQTYNNWEIILWDNMSTDLTETIYRKSFCNEKRIKYFKSNSHTSLGEARFLASQYLSGDYIAILDVDDLYHPDKLKKQIEFMTKNPFVHLTSTWSYLINDADKILNKKKITLNDSKISETILWTNPFIHSTLIYKKDIFDYLGGYNKKLIFASDYDLLSRFRINNFNSSIVKELLTYQRIHKHSMSKDPKIINTIIDENIFILSKLQKIISDSNLLQLNNKSILLFKLRKLLNKPIRNINIRDILSIIKIIINNPFIFFHIGSIRRFFKSDV